MNIPDAEAWLRTVFHSQATQQLLSWRDTRTDEVYASASCALSIVVGVLVALSYGAPSATVIALGIFLVVFLLVDVFRADGERTDSQSAWAQTYGLAESGQLAKTLQLVPALIAPNKNLVAIAGAGAGNSPPLPVFETGARDGRGALSFGAGASAAAGPQVAVTFKVPFNEAPTVVLTARNVATAVLGLAGTSVTKTGFEVSTASVPPTTGNTVPYAVSWVALT
jgi:hypothetical protein